MEFSTYTISKIGFVRSYYEIAINDEIYYTVKPESIFNSRKYTFYDYNDSALLVIERPFSILSTSFNIIENNEQIGEVKVAPLSYTHAANSIYGTHTIKGDIIGKEFVISNEKEEVAMISKKRFQRKNMYGVAIMKSENELYILALILINELLSRLRKKRRS